MIQLLKYLLTLTCWVHIDHRVLVSIFGHIDAVALAQIDHTLRSIAGCSQTVLLMSRHSSGAGTDPFQTSIKYTLGGPAYREQAIQY